MQTRNNTKQFAITKDKELEIYDASTQLVNTLKKLGNSYLQEHPRCVFGYTDQFSASQLAELDIPSTEDMPFPLFTLLTIFRAIKRIARTSYLIVEIEKTLTHYKPYFMEFSHLNCNHTDYKSRVLASLKQYILVRVKQSDIDPSDRDFFRNRFRDAELYDLIEEKKFIEVRNRLSFLSQSTQHNKLQIADKPSSQSPKLPHLIFGEIHKNEITEIFISCVLKKLKEIGYERFYEEFPIGASAQDYLHFFQNKAKNRFLKNIQAADIEFRPIDLPNFWPKKIEEINALLPDRNTAMAWHLRAADVPIIFRVGKAHIEGIQYELLEQHQLSATELNERYLFINISSDEDEDVDQSLTNFSGKNQTYPIAEPMSVIINTNEDSKKAVEILFQEIEKRNRINVGFHKKHLTQPTNISNQPKK